MTGAPGLKPGRPDPVGRPARCGRPKHTTKGSGMTQSIGDLNPVELLALSRIKASEARDQVSPGTHPVDFTVRVQGSVKVGEDTEKAPTVRLPHLAVMALFIQRMGFQRDHATAVLMNCMREALEMDTSARDTLLANFPEIATCEEGLRTMMAALPPIKERGHVTVKLAIQQV